MINVMVTLGSMYSGKSRWVEQVRRSHENVVVICPDELRKRLTGSISDQSKNAEVFAKAFYDLETTCWEFTKHDIDGIVVFDSTGLNLSTHSTIFHRLMWNTEIEFTLVAFESSGYVDVLLARKEADAERIANGERSNVPDSVVRKAVGRYKDVLDSLTGFAADKMVRRYDTVLKVDLTGIVRNFHTGLELE